MPSDFKKASAICKDYLKGEYSFSDYEANDVIKRVNVRRAYFIMEKSSGVADDAITVAGLGVAQAELKRCACAWASKFRQSVIDLAKVDYYKITKEEIAVAPKSLMEGAARLFMSEGMVAIDLARTVPASEALGILSIYKDYAKFKGLDDGVYDAFENEYNEIISTLGKHMEQDGGIKVSPIKRNTNGRAFD